MNRIDAEGARNLSLFRPLGYQRNSCGYCKSDNGSASYYCTSVTVRPEHYEELVNRGWRRSGTIYYKPNLARSCCPHYTIRLEASEFKARRDQRKAVNKWNNFVLGPEYMRKAARLCPKTREEKKRRKCNFDVLTAVHEAEYANVKRPVDPATEKPIEPAHRFEVNLEGDSVSQEKFDLFAKYQTKVHKDKLSELKVKDFKRFLCSGLKRSPTSPQSSQRRLGSWHQCYRLDGKLIAVAVLDLIPHGVSSVYVFYDPEYEAWEFGKLSALREIALTIEGGYQYYYMGYYIHNNQKMRYKGTFRPQYVLDPESHTWNPLDGELAQKFDRRLYVSLSRDHRTTPAPEAEAGTDPETNINDEDETLSLFDLHMPGILTPAQVQTHLDLDHWLLRIHGIFVHMNDLVGWEAMDMEHPVKRIIAELAAALGPGVVGGSAVVLFE